MIISKWNREGIKKRTRTRVYVSTRRKGRASCGTARSYLHAPDRMSEDPDTTLRGVRLRGPGLRPVLSHTRSPRGSNCDWIQPRARQDRVLRSARIASGPAATGRGRSKKLGGGQGVVFAVPVGGESGGEPTLIRCAGRWAASADGKIADVALDAGLNFSERVPLGEKRKKEGPSAHFACLLFHFTECVTRVVALHKLYLWNGLSFFSRQSWT